MYICKYVCMHVLCMDICGHVCMNLNFWFSCLYLSVYVLLCTMPSLQSAEHQAQGFLYIRAQPWDQIQGFEAYSCAHLQYSAEININRSNCSDYWAGGQIHRQRFLNGGGGGKGVFWESMAFFQSCQSSTSQSVMEKTSESFSPRRHRELKHEIRDYSSFKEKYVQWRRERNQ